jgi:2-amino-4-hydroxy-6-hydroxymethyldihydropteridine diphosphokinase
VEEHAVWLGLGTNLGDRAGNLAGCVRALRRILKVEAISGVYETEPVGHREQPVFWNAVVRGSTTLRPAALLLELKRLERELGRTETFRMGPRIIDIDILLYDDVVSVTPQLTIPHPGLAERAFVLCPLLELDPALRHPATGEPMADLPAAVEPGGIRRLGAAADLLPLDEGRTG